MCGENSSLLLMSSHQAGSPPRVRGKQRRKNSLCDHPGITPACAGKTATGHAIPCRGWDHPRVCGENSPTGFSVPSSRRITPACAGKTSSAKGTVRAEKDHPRVCGENLCAAHVESGRQGSPPRVRGKLGRADGYEAVRRITPACAGKTCWRKRRKADWTDHPRACGENELWRRRTEPRLGSPPRMRGKHFGNGVFPWLILVLSLDSL